ncbi:nucleotide 5'-monophosphate nucleosidase PpnN [Candidatus Macondimonas diazotrophica]|uniref:nucleotide 5'-monophosphate nucleosidase PpnN n=1 Tax=Candidatus Macondimonas diazotrophica TaxID=2305248 RepID=UPI0023EF50EA|nr:nucleotide 5'-monophosphate nucleosidase PpnN [Candidatus Macondimonas diazotrophica]
MPTIDSLNSALVVDKPQVVDALIAPEGSLEVLSQHEVVRLRDTSLGGLHELLRRCALAVLNSGSVEDDSRQVMERYRNFDIQVVQQERGIKLELRNAPAAAFVDGQMIRGIREHLFAVLRDLVYVHNEIRLHPRFDLMAPGGITDAVFHTLRNARALFPGQPPNLVVCWGGHSISRLEYEYAKRVGYELGLRGMDICTGCGPGAMKGPMKGAAVGHAKQHRSSGRYVGISEPGIIAAEPPNPIVNHLVIMPDMEKRLEAFVRIGHGFVVFPGGVGTMEELLYLFAILLHEENAEIPFPLILTGPVESADYFRRLEDFLTNTLGSAVSRRYQVILDDPVAVARAMRRGMEEVRRFRIARSDAFYFNWVLRIAPTLQTPFVPTHANMAGLSLHRDQPLHDLAANLRAAFSGIVSGNVKESGIQAIEAHGPFQMRGAADVMRSLDNLLDSFVREQRMRLPGRSYTPCYEIVV